MSPNEPAVLPGSADVARLSGAEARALIRTGGWRRPTAGLAAGYVQANLVVLPRAAADDFRRFCARNPRPCPLLDVTATGSDLRLDLPRFSVYRDGRLTEEVDHLTDLWRPDFVGFLLGCSFTFEAALVRAGVAVRHQELGCNVPMYRTDRPCRPAGPFRGPLVVSMRPIPHAMVARGDGDGALPAGPRRARSRRGPGAPRHHGPGPAGLR
jgi:uncharacterized protein YcsI (UPF0317 family)